MVNDKCLLLLILTRVSVNLDPCLGNRPALRKFCVLASTSPTKLLLISQIFTTVLILVLILIFILIRTLIITLIINKSFILLPYSLSILTFPYCPKTGSV